MVKRLEYYYVDSEKVEVVEEFIIKNGKEIKTKTQKMPFEDAEEYFENYQ